MRVLSREEQALFDEMKERCLAKGQYKDEKAKDKFKMLCHLEDFMIQYWELLKENKQLKIQISAREEVCNRLESNWNKLKEYCKENTLCYEVGDDENTKLIGSKIHGLNVLDKMQELEQESDNNE